MTLTLIFVPDTTLLPPRGVGRKWHEPAKRRDGGEYRYENRLRDSSDSRGHHERSGRATGVTAIARHRISRRSGLAIRHNRRIHSLAANPHNEWEDYCTAWLTSQCISWSHSSACCILSARPNGKTRTKKKPADAPFTRSQQLHIFAGQYPPPPRGGRRFTLRGARPRTMSNNSRQSPLDDGGYTTVESQVDYKPELLGTAQLEAGEPEQEWPNYGLELVPIQMDGQDTGRRLIRRNGEFVADVSDRYTLAPNEEVVHAANQVASQLGATPFHEFEGDWFIKLDDHVFQDQNAHRVHALYAWNDPVDLGDGDEIQMGFAVHNSIDGSLSFQTGLFTFRHACQNMVTMGVGGQGMSFDDREVVAHDSRRHTGDLNINQESLKREIDEMMFLVDDIQDTYRAWRDQFVEVGDVIGLIDRLPRKDLPPWIRNIEDQLEAAEEQLQDETGDEAAELSPEQRQNIVRDELPATETVWSTYNDVTESIWHDEKSGDLTKDRKFDKLHRVYEPAPGVR